MKPQTELYLIVKSLSNKTTALSKAIQDVGGPSKTAQKCIDLAKAYDNGHMNEALQLLRAIVQDVEHMGDADYDDLYTEKSRSVEQFGAVTLQSDDARGVGPAEA